MLLIHSPAFLRRSGFSFIGLSFLLLTSTAIIADETNKQPNNIHIRTLAASCAACHGTNGNSRSITPVLARLDAHYFTTQMMAFKHKSRESTVMHHHASGLTDIEINQLADYFSQQKRISLPPLTSEVLRDKP